LTELINQIAKSSTRALLVLDDYHVIESMQIDRAVSFFVSNLPPQIHLVIATRTDPTFPLSRLRSLRQLTEIRADDLRFSLEEAALFLEKGMGLKVSVGDIATLEARTEGWIVGLQLAAISIQRLKHQYEITRFVENFSSSNRYILDYLTDEVLQQRPVGTRDFLLQTSILSRLSAPLCQAVTGMENSQEILETLDAVNLFLIPLDDECCWYRYHHLFDDLLQKRLGLLQPDFISELHHRAAGWYKQNGWISEALDHLLAAGDYHGAADLVEQNARALLERSELATVMTWVDALPGTQVRDRPWLCVYHAWALRLSGAPFDAVESRIEEAEVAIQKYIQSQEDNTSVDESTRLKNQIDKLNGHIFGLQSFQHLYKENIPRVLELTQSAQALKPEENFVRASISFARGWALRFSGDLELAYQAFANTKKFSLASGNIYLAVAGTCRAAYGHILGGELRQANKHLHEAIDIATVSEGKQYPVVGYAYVYLGGILYEWNDLETANRYLKEGIELCAQVGFIMDQVVGLVILAQVQRVFGDWDAVQDAIQKAENLSQKMKSYVYVRRWVENTQVRLWLAQNDWNEICRWIQTCGLTIDDNLDYSRDLEHTILARALVYSGINLPEFTDIRDALTLLGRLLEKAETAKWWGKAIEILSLQALAFQTLGDYQNALSSLKKAITQAEPEGYIRTFIDEGQPMHRLISDLREAMVQNPAVEEQSLVRHLDRILLVFDQEKTGELGDRFTKDSITERQSIVEPLSNREREVLYLMADGKTNQEIALELVIAVTTAKKHVSNIIGKFGVTNRTQAVARARALNLI
jgi:LuxR family maltose regulon positive regulatory protein